MSRTGRRDGNLRSRRVIDIAEGILIGLRHCSVQTAFNELITVAQRHDTTVFAVATALVELAMNTTATRTPDVPAQAAAHTEWGQLLHAAHTGHRFVAPGVTQC